MDRERLRELILACIHQGEVTLASGAKSDFYVDGRLVTLSAEGSALVAEAVLEEARDRGATALGGPTTGACPMVSASGLLAHQRGTALKLCYVRAQAKGHGLQKAIEGPPLGAGDRVLVVDDVMTSGGSVAQAIERLREQGGGAEVVGAFCLVDREAGGRERIEALGVPFRALYTRSDLER